MNGNKKHDSILLNIDYSVLDNNRQDKIVVDWSYDGDDSDVVEATVGDAQ